MLFALLVAFLLAACGDPDRNRVSPRIEGPTRIALTDEPVEFTFSSGTDPSSGIYLTLYGGPAGNQLIDRTEFLVDTSSSVTLRGVKFDYQSVGSGGGRLSFVMNRAQYEAIKTPSGTPLTKMYIDLGAKANLSVTTFGDGFFSFNQAYYYGTEGGQDGRALTRLTYTADPDQVRNIRKSWTFSKDGTVRQEFSEQCATYAHILRTCTTGPTDTFWASPSPLPAGVYDVTVETMDVVRREPAGTYTTKLIVAPPPVAKLKVDGPSTTTVGATVRFDATESVAGGGSTILYLLTVPEGSNATLRNEDTQNPSFVADVRGTYTLTLYVSFNGEVSTATVSRLVTPPVTGASGG
ncbi:MAG: hypothetical protein EOO21_00495 [Comamonadaceae bacterium]|nr:MAG: hypothetical protein EOO21_00495 [Comamonadaceae bacterium]